MVIEAKYYFLLKKMDPPKLGLDLTDRFQKGMILEVFVKMIMVTFVLVISKICLPCVSSVCTLDPSLS